MISNVKFAWKSFSKRVGSRYRFHTSQSTCSKNKTHYETLGVPQTASHEQIKTAFLNLSKQHHPDMDPTNKDLHQRFIEINEAYSILSKTPSRLKYDDEQLVKKIHKPADQPYHDRHTGEDEEDNHEKWKFDSDRGNRKRQPFQPYLNEWFFFYFVFAMICFAGGYHFIRYRILVHTRKSEMKKKIADQREADEDDETFIRNVRNREQ